MLEDRQFDDFLLGDHVSFVRTFRAADFEAFAGLSGDRSPLHHDGAYSAETRFARPIVPLAMAAAPFSAIAGTMLPGHRSLVLDCQTRAIGPVPYDTPVEYSGRIVAKHEAGQVLELGLLAFQGRRVLVDGRLRVQVRADPPVGCWAEGDPAPISRAADERVALVTGGSGSIGGAVSLSLARRGWKLLLQVRDPERGNHVAAACRKAGAETRLLVGSLGSREDRQRLLEALEREVPPAAFIHSASPAIDAGHDALVEVNYAAARDFCQVLLPGMLRRQSGRIIFIASDALQRAPDGWDDYVAAKQAAVGYLRALDRRYSAYGVTCAAVAPGFVLTPFSQPWRPAEASCLLPEEVAEAVVEELEPSGGGWYVRLGPDMRERGDFGFQPARTETPSAAPRPSLGKHAPRSSSGGDNLDDLVRSFFRLPLEENIEQAGIDATPGWDSLGHLQLLLHLESALGVSFTSPEAGQAVSYRELRRLVDAKLGGV